MSWLYFMLFAGGVVLGIMAWYLEKRNDQVKKINRSVIKILFILALILIIIGITMVYASILRIGIFVFIFTFGLFLTRRTFLYLKVRH